MVAEHNVRTGWDEDKIECICKPLAAREKRSRPARGSVHAVDGISKLGSYLKVAVFVELDGSRDLSEASGVNCRLYDVVHRSVAAIAPVQIAVRTDGEAVDLSPAAWGDGSGRATGKRVLDDFLALEVGDKQAGRPKGHTV